MRENRFNDELIIRMFKDYDGGVPTAAIYRTHGLCPAMFYNKFRFKLSALDVSDGRKLTCLEQVECSRKNDPFFNLVLVP